MTKLYYLIDEGTAELPFEDCPHCPSRGILPARPEYLPTSPSFTHRQTAFEVDENGVGNLVTREDGVALNSMAHPGSDPYPAWFCGAMLINPTEGGCISIDDTAVMDRATYEALKEKAWKYDQLCK